jgi:hypothetical protein
MVLHFEALREAEEPRSPTILACPQASSCRFTSAAPEYPLVAVPVGGGGGAGFFHRWWQ